VVVGKTLGANAQVMNDPFDLKRFLDAQAPHFDAAIAELRAGRKRTHWMWFIFPQLAGLGSSATARLFAIRSREEAQAFWDHPVLGARLRESFEALLPHRDLSAHEIFGTPDDLKLRSCATLFLTVTRARICQDVLDRFFGGQPDAVTLRLLAEAPGAKK
jgi:uncharacterized protein (DUF1810 family)